MTLREETQRLERETLSPWAAFSDATKGRERPEEECQLRTPYQRDRDRILHCKSFRRLKQKTQVFLLPKGDHYRTRLTHTLEVSQNARTIAKALRLNEDLTEAAALGHDLGHTPFGHAGEHALNEICPLGFAHYRQSVRVVEVLENKGRGLNLTWEVRDGIRNHRTSGTPHTLEGQIVRYCDKIAYINHDIDDAIRAQIMVEEDIPKELCDILGYTTKERLNTLIHNIITNSIGKDDIMMSKKVEEAMHRLRRFMFEHVYKNPVAKGEEEKARGLLKQLYYYYMEHMELIPKKYTNMLYNGESRVRDVCDYTSGMTDQYAITKFEEFFLHQAWQVDGY